MTLLLLRSRLDCAVQLTWAKYKFNFMRPWNIISVCQVLKTTLGSAMTTLVNLLPTPCSQLPTLPVFPLRFKFPLLQFQTITSSSVQDEHREQITIIFGTAFMYFIFFFKVFIHLKPVRFLLLWKITPNLSFFPTFQNLISVVAHF